jgi:hypothetical protein
MIDISILYSVFSIQFISHLFHKRDQRRCFWFIRYPFVIHITVYITSYSWKQSRVLCCSVLPVAALHTVLRRLRLRIAYLGCHNGRDFLILAYHNSGWPPFVPFLDKNTSACKIVDAVRSYFSFGAGMPVKFWSDSGPQFTSDQPRHFIHRLLSFKGVGEEHEKAHPWFMDSRMF